MRADLVIYSALLVLGVGAAYYSTLPSESGEDSSVKILSLEPKNIDEITFSSSQEDLGIKVDVSAKKRDTDDRFMIVYNKVETPKPAKKEEPKEPEQPHVSPPDESPETDKPKSEEEKKPDAPESPPPAPIITTEEFLGNEQMEDILKSLNPLMASRVFTQVDEKQLEEFGLKTPPQKMTIKTADGKTQSFLLGRKSYGSPQRFLLEETANGPKRVLLVDDEIFAQLENAHRRLYDRRYLADDFETVTKAEIKTPGGILKKISHTQKNKDGTLLWTDDEPDAQAKPSYDSFMDRIEKLRLAKYAPKDVEEKLQTTEPFLSITFEKDSKVIDTVQFKKILTADNKAQYFVTSQFLKSHGEIQATRMEGLEKDVETVFKK